MNLVLLELAEVSTPLTRTDPRAQHILKVLRREVGDSFDVGLVNGPLGKAHITRITTEHIVLDYTWLPSPPPLPQTTLLIGLPRPQTARDILRDATTLGATTIHFIRTERADPNYATSSLWQSEEWRRHCLAGAAQAFDTRIPAISWHHSLTTALSALPPDISRIALDNYEASAPLQTLSTTSTHPSSGLVLAFGPERGWGPLDRETLRAADFKLAHLGSRVLRVETAVVAALAITRAR